MNDCRIMPPRQSSAIFRILCENRFCLNICSVHFMQLGEFFVPSTKICSVQLCKRYVVTCTLNMYNLLATTTALNTTCLSGSRVCTSHALWTLKRLSHTVHCTLYIVHCTLYIVHCTVYSSTVHIIYNFYNTILLCT